MGAVQQTGREGKTAAMQAAGWLEQTPEQGRKTDDCNPLGSTVKPELFWLCLPEDSCGSKLWEGKPIPINNCGCVTAKWHKCFILIKGKVVFLTKRDLCREGAHVVTFMDLRKLQDACCKKDTLSIRSQVGRGKGDKVLSARSKEEISQLTFPQTERRSGWTCFPS